MYIYSECVDKINKYLDIIRNIKQDNIKTFFRLHGTYASGKITYLSDIDVEYFIKFQDNIDEIKGFMQYFMKILFSNPKFIFAKSISGWDDRFVFPFNIMKDGSIVGYDSALIKTRLDNLLKQNVINQTEYNKIIEFVVAKPTLFTFEKLKLALEDFQILFWTYDELMKGIKEYRGKTFKLEETLLYPRFPTIITLLQEFDDSKYVDIDLTIFLYKNLKDNKSNISKNITYHEFDSNVVLLNDRNRTLTTLYVYHGIFKNIVQNKYLKVLKRIRTVLSTYTFDKKNTMNLTTEVGRDLRYRGLIRQVREDIGKSYNTELGIFNQLKNRISDILFLIDIKDKMEIRKLIVEVMKDLMATSFDDITLVKSINDELKNKKYDKEKLRSLMKELGDKVMKKMNDDALPLLINVYNKIKHILPFKLILPYPSLNKT